MFSCHSFILISGYDRFRNNVIKTSKDCSWISIPGVSPTNATVSHRCPPHCQTIEHWLKVSLYISLKCLYLPDRRPPAALMKVVDESGAVLDHLLSDLPIECTQPISGQGMEYTYTLAYLMSWKLLLYFFKSAPSEVSSKACLVLYCNTFHKTILHIYIQPHWFMFLKWPIELCGDVLFVNSVWA